MKLRPLSLALLLLALSACKSTAGDPVEPVPGSGGETVEGDYPAGPYGTTVGETIQAFCFEGYVNPSEGTGEGFTSTICLNDLYNPTREALHDDESPFPSGTPKPKVIMVNIGAVWCQPCKEEAATILPKEYDEFAPQGMELISVLTDSETPGDPADLDNLDAWVNAFDNDYPTVIDPQYTIGTLIDTTQYPANFLIRASDMAISELVIGKPQDSFFTKLEALLGEDE